MAENTGAATGQGSEAAEPQGGASQDQPQPQGSAADTETSTDVEALERTLNEMKRDNAKYRAELRRIQEASKAAEMEALPERERFDRERADWQREREEFLREREATERERQESRLRDAVISTASRLGFIDPMDAYVHLDKSSISFGENGQPHGLTKALNDILESKSYLAAPNPLATVTRGVQGGGRVRGSSIDDLIRQKAGYMP